MPAAITILATEGPGAPAPDRGRASADALIAGEYATPTWNAFTGEGDRLYCGTWECTPGKVKVNYVEWEFCHILSGTAVLTNEAGESWTVKTGDGFIIPAGFRGTWETVETLRKHYVILMPPAAA